MKNLFADTVEAMRSRQMQEWELAKLNYESLNAVETKKTDLGNCLFSVQFNPARIRSSAAKIDRQSIEERECFLCRQNLPQQQKACDFIGRYLVLVNPFPVFPKHLTIPSYSHQAQRIRGRLIDMLDLVRDLDEYVVFYNGPKCGASAPDHFHFQAGSKGLLPLEKYFDSFKKELVYQETGIGLFELADYPCPVLVFESDSRTLINKQFEVAYNLLPVAEGDDEPMMNIVVWYSGKQYRLCLFPRKQHRPSCYYANEGDNLLVSPASVEMAGLFIAARKDDFDRITAKAIGQIVEEVCIGQNELKQIANRLKEINHEP